MKVKSSFYQRDDVVLIARELLGKVLYVNSDEGVTAARIVETEAYSYIEQACHAYNNKRTRRTETLYAAGGTSYVYLCYGIHKLFNIVTNEEGIAEAVLVRAVEPIINIQLMKDRRKRTRPGSLTSGPGKLSMALGITLDHNCKDLAGDQLWLEDDGYSLPENNIISKTRIGVDYAGEDARLPWRFYIRDNAFVSVS